MGKLFFMKKMRQLFDAHFVFREKEGDDFAFYLLRVAGMPFMWLILVWSVWDLKAAIQLCFHAHGHQGVASIVGNGFWLICNGVTIYCLRYVRQQYLLHKAG